MMSSEAGRGGFYLPIIYEKKQKEVEQNLERAEIDYADLSKWNFPDEFLCFVMELGLLKFVDDSYPSPRVKHEVPIWFLITCQFLMRLYQTGKYNHLRYLLNAGSILSRFGFNVGSRDVGFNDKNKKIRKDAVDADTVRKFFKDTDRDDIRSWYNQDLQAWFKAQRAFNRRGIFVLDQSHLVVPDNVNYQDAVRMPVDEHGQLYPHLKTLTQEQRRSLIYHPCYAITTLLNIGLDKSTFHVAGYELGPGNEDELIQAGRLVPDFCRRFPGLLKELIVDRGYISGELIEKIKHDHDVHTLIPLRSNMDAYIDAIAIAKQKNDWTQIEIEVDEHDNLLHKTDAAIVNDVELWLGGQNKQQCIVSRYTVWDSAQKTKNESFSVLASTRRYRNPATAVERYCLRMQTEERFRQFKHGWYISEFPSPHASLIESHVCFTLLTYSLLQFYFRREDLKEKTKHMIATLRADESLGKDAVVVYSGNRYAVLGLDDYTVTVAGMELTPRMRLIALMKKQKEERLKRGY